MKNAKWKNKLYICSSTNSPDELTISNNNKSNNGSSNIMLSSKDISTCNHCFGSKKKHENEKILARRKTESSSSLLSLTPPPYESMQQRQSILLSNNPDLKKRFNLSTHSIVSLQKSPEFAEMPASWNAKNNKNKSCSKHETWNHMNIIFGNMSQVNEKNNKFNWKNLIKIQKSNNASKIKCQRETFDDDINEDFIKSNNHNSMSSHIMEAGEHQNKLSEERDIRRTETFIERFKELKSQNRFIFVKELGEGSFGQVLECLDIKKKRLPVAIKVSKNVLSESKKLYEEVNILERINGIYDSPHNPCATLMQWFKLENRLCMVFQRYGDNLFTFMKKRKFRPLPIELILQIAYQLLNATLFLHEKCELIHTDLKPENIVLCSPIYIMKEERDSKINMIPSKLDIKIIDFGNALLNKGKTYSRMIGTRNYRAVEVILGQPWNYKIDYWSIGCIFYELYTGKVLFLGKNDSHQLAFIDKIMGPINEEMTKTSKKAHLFLRNGRFNKAALDDYHVIEQNESFEKHFKNSSYKSKLFISSMANLLKINPSLRLDIKTILQTPLFSQIPDYLKRRFKHFSSNSPNTNQRPSNI